MTEAVNTLNEWAFAHPEVRAITATHVLAKNFASQKVLMKTGFTEISSDSEFINFILHRANH
jgi:RimJ/RimL family protein N-acetyltransferase